MGDNLDQTSKSYNVAHKKTRCLIERSIGILKNRFPCLHKLRVKTPIYAAAVVKACVTLHNMCINVEGAPDEAVLQYIDDYLDEHEANEPVGLGIIENQERRQQIIELFRN